MICGELLHFYFAKVLSSEQIASVRHFSTKLVTDYESKRGKHVDKSRFVDISYNYLNQRRLCIMNELLVALKTLAEKNLSGIKRISTLDGLDNMFVIEMKNGKKYAVSLLELE